MMTNEYGADNRNIWNDDTNVETLQQIAELCRQTTGRNAKIASDGRSFAIEKDSKTRARGILSVQGRLVDDDIIEVSVELLRCPKNLRVATGVFFERLSKLGEKTRLISSNPDSCGQSSLGVELKVKATPMSLTRTQAFLAELKNLNELANALQNELPTRKNNDELTRLYSEYSETLEPIMPWEVEKDPSTLLSWADEIVNLVLSSCNVAIASPSPTILDMALAALASIGQGYGRSFGRFLPPSVNAGSLVNLARKAPGTVAVSAAKLSLGTSPYELGNEMNSMLISLSNINRPAVFYGKYEELQMIFHGGQGGGNDPLLPIVRRVPEIAINSVVVFCVQSAGIKIGGISAAAEKQLAFAAIEAIESVHPAKRLKILPAVVNHLIYCRQAGKPESKAASTAFVSSVANLSETLAGLSPVPRTVRSSEVQERFISVMADPNLFAYFNHRLLSQENALRMLTSRLRTECMTRPLHQPIRYLAQGTVATGKSE